MKITEIKKLKNEENQNDNDTNKMTSKKKLK